MMQRPAPNDLRRLRSYLHQAGEVGFRSYVALIIGTLRDRARQTENTLDDLIVMVLEVAIARLFPQDAGDQSANQG